MSGRIRWVYVVRDCATGRFIAYFFNEGDALDKVSTVNDRAGDYVLEYVGPRTVSK